MHDHEVTSHQEHAFGEVRTKRADLLDLLQENTPIVYTPEGNFAPSPVAKLYWKLRDCCRHAAVWKRGDGGLAVSRARCKSRLCPLCGQIRAKQMATELDRRTRGMEVMRFLTLGVRGTGEKLAVQVKRLMGNFARLRRTKAWRRHVTGGAATVEITWSAAKSVWHPHLHILIDGQYWAQKEILAVWQEICADQASVDIRLIYSRRQLTNYMTKYVTKSQAAEGVPAARLEDWILGMKGVRMLITFGTMHGKKAKKEPEETPAAAERICSLAEIAEYARWGDDEARTLYKGLLRLRRFPAATDQSVEAAEIRAGHASVAAMLDTWLRRVNAELLTGYGDGAAKAAPPPRPPDPLLFGIAATYAGDV